MSANAKEFNASDSYVLSPACVLSQEEFTDLLPFRSEYRRSRTGRRCPRRLPGRGASFPRVVQDQHRHPGAGQNLERHESFQHRAGRIFVAAGQKRRQRVDHHQIETLIRPKLEKMVHQGLPFLRMRLALKRPAVATNMVAKGHWGRGRGEVVRWCGELQNRACCPPTTSLPHYPATISGQILSGLVT